MITIELNGLTLTLTEETANRIYEELDEIRREKERELYREQNERRFHWYMWHWYARRYAMYNREEDYEQFSDMWKDENGIRPWHITPEEIIVTLNGRR